jgi:protein TonB
VPAAAQRAANADADRRQPEAAGAHAAETQSAETGPDGPTADAAADAEDTRDPTRTQTASRDPARGAGGGSPSAAGGDGAAGRGRDRGGQGDAAAGGEAGGTGPQLPAGGAGNPQPDYPLSARRKGWEGRVLVEVLVSPEGRAREVKLARSSGHEILDAAALDAVRDWQFRPAERNGQAVAGRIRVPISFRLTGR